MEDGRTRADPPPAIGCTGCRRQRIAPEGRTGSVRGETALDGRPLAVSDRVADNLESPEASVARAAGRALIASWAGIRAIPAHPSRWSRREATRSPTAADRSTTLSAGCTRPAIPPYSAGQCRRIGLLPSASARPREEAHHARAGECGGSQAARAPHQG